jgi:hypothetical protein
MIVRSESDSTDLETGLYISLEKFSTDTTSTCYGSSSIEEDFSIKKCGIFIIVPSEGRIDYIISTYSSVFKFINSYSHELNFTDIFLFSNSSISFFLSPGENIIIPSKTWEKPNEGYSIFCMEGEAKIKIYESETQDGLFTFISGKTLKINYF